VDVCGIAREEHAPPAVRGHLTMVDLKAGQPMCRCDGDTADPFVNGDHAGSEG
jgi:hypothetical protein